jgi:sulfur-oxidizing protein SoxA
MPVTPPDDPRLTPFRERGRALFNQRIGQLGLTCAQCHDANWGGRLGGSTIPQGHPNGYPLYRLEWQSVGSLQRRLRNCMTGVRAEPFAYGASELIDLEVYLSARGTGLAIEAPAIRP